MFVRWELITEYRTGKLFWRTSLPILLIGVLTYLPFKRCFQNGYKIVRIFLSMNSRHSLEPKI